MIIRYSPRSSRDLEAIHAYLVQRSPQGALNVLRAIYGSIEFVRRYPRAAETTSISGVHVMMVRRYRFKIFYRVVEAENVVEIVHVRHTSRRPWSGEDD
jgi:plasmid stabilization system protein ParE